MRASSLFTLIARSGALRRIPTALLAALLFNVWAPASMAGEINFAPAPLYRLAQSIEAGQRYEDSLEFARISIQEMIAEFAAVAIEARSERSLRRANRRKSWSNGTDGYVALLRTTLSTLERGSDVAVFTEERGDVTLRIGGQPLIVTGPRLDRPDGLAWRILERYCAREICPTTLFDRALNPPLPHGVWSIGDEGVSTLTTTVGIDCIFDDLSNRQEKEWFCKGLSREVSVLLVALRRTRALGYHIDWNEVRVGSSVETDEEPVFINGGRDYLRLALPILAGSEHLQHATIPWLEGRMSGRRTHLVIRDADRFVAGAPG